MLRYPVVFSRPRRLTDVESWQLHIPFAFFIMALHRPKRLVELGTYKGDSYCAFCQAADEMNLGCECFAIDHWKGDPQTGLYGDEVLEDLRSHHDPLYGSFSRLVRSSFDDAVAGIDDCSIDLLHIDGYHSYDSVKHDFETWLPKLSRRGLVLLHDTHVHEQGFGVHRLWDELSGRYPSIVFSFGNGLGALAAGAGVGEEVLIFFQKFRAAAALFESAFERLGSAVLLEGRSARMAAEARRLQEGMSGMNARLEALERDRERQESDAREMSASFSRQAEELRSCVEEQGRQAEEFRSRIEDHERLSELLQWKVETLTLEGERIRGERDRAEAEKKSLNRMLAEKEKQHEMAVEMAAARDQQLADLNQSLAARDQQLADINQSLAARDQQLASLNQIILESNERFSLLEREAAMLNETIIRIRASLSWRLTAPVRFMLSWFPWLWRNCTKDVHQTLGATAKTHVNPDAIVTDTITPATHMSVVQAHVVQLEDFLRSSETLEFPAVKRPKVSLIIVLHNRADWTLACLRSICSELANLSGGYEIVIVDNASSDETSMLLERIRGAVIIRNIRNIWYAGAVNAAAARAKGSYLLLLNNDMILLPGSVEAAITALESHRDVGAVGGRLVHLDGCLQEAGSMIWQDGSCLGYGRGDDPWCPAYLFRRPVDYCSGAFLLTPRDTFCEMGGFDENYSPMYYEDTDYCCRIWQVGKRVLYEPSAMVLHEEHGSGDVVSARMMMEEKMRYFVQKHADWLRSQMPYSQQNILYARLRRKDANRILVIDDMIPHLWLGAGFPRANAILHALVEMGFDVSIYPMLGVSSLREVYGDIPRTVEVLGEGSYSIETLKQVLRERCDYYRHLFVSRPHNMARVLLALEAMPDFRKKINLIYDAEAIFCLRTALQRQVLGQPLREEELTSMICEEVGLARAADVVCAVSDDERETFRRYGVTRVAVVGHALCSNPTPSAFEERSGILFVGAINGDEEPNADGICWFVKEILPLLDAMMGDEVAVSVAGVNRSERIKSLLQNRVRTLGIVDDLKPLYDRTCIFIAPTRFAAGIPLKILDAAAHGVPCVATSLLQKELGWKAGTDLAVGDTPEEFAARCHELLTDGDLWSRIRGSALQRVRLDCSQERFVSALGDAVGLTSCRGCCSGNKGNEPDNIAENDDYQVWIRSNEPGQQELMVQRHESARLEYRPKISVLMPVWNPDTRWLRLAVESLIGQTYDCWELCVAEGNSEEQEVRSMLEKYLVKDSRIKAAWLPQNRGIAGNASEALAIATGEFVVLMDHDDELAPFALFEVAKALNEDRRLDFLYSDEDLIDTYGRRHHPFFKPGWSPDLLLSWMYTCHLGAYRKSILEDVGGFRPGYDGSQDHDLVLRLTEKTNRIHHIPKILYHWRTIPQSAAGQNAQAKPYAHAAGIRAIESYLERNAIEGMVLDGETSGLYRVVRRVKGNPLISIVIPTRDNRLLLQSCIESIVQKTEYQHYEIIVVDNKSRESDAIDYLKYISQRGHIEVLQYDKPFNYSAINNYAVTKSRGEYILCLNNDTEVINRGWLLAMLEHAQRLEVGAVGAKLLFPDNRIQHCGVIIGIAGVAGHMLYGLQSHGGRPSAVGNYSAVTAACLMLRRNVFDKVGGFDEHLSVLYNDVDLCLRLRALGYLVVYTPYAQLYHYESKTKVNTKGGDPYPNDTNYFKARWDETIRRGDPYYNPNLALDRADGSFRI